MSDKLLSSKTYWNAVVQLAHEYDVDIDACVEQVNAREHSQYVPFADLKVLIEKVIFATSLPWLGLVLGPRLVISSHGSVGFALSSCRDLAECFQLISQYDQTRVQFLDVTGEHSGDSFQLLIREKCHWEPVRQPIFETMVIGMLNMIAYVVGDKVGMCRIGFPFPEPEWSERYKALYQCEYFFNQASCFISIPSSLLSVPSISYDERSLARAKEQCDQELSSLREMDTLAQTVRNLITEGERYTLSIDAAAKCLNISTSTLIRKLKKEDTSYRSIVEEIKKARIISLLCNSTQSVESIAFTVGYSDASNFGRSFRRWYGCSPSEYRHRFKKK